MERGSAVPRRVARSLFETGVNAAADLSPPDPAGLAIGDRPRLFVLLRSFYADPLAWIALLVFTAVLTYGGGVALFWYHAIHLGEGGPAVSPWLHWLLDSSVGFVGLAPAIAVILPVAAWRASRRGGADPAGSAASATTSPPVVADPIRPARFALIGGTMMAVVTAPAPLLHDTFIARGTPLADAITTRWGNGYAPPPESAEVSAFMEMWRQVLAGIPTYIVCMWVAAIAMRRVVRINLPLSSRRSSR